MALPAGQLDRTSQPRHVLIRPVPGHDIGVFDLQAGKIVKGWDKPTADLWGEEYGDRVCVKASPKNPVRFDMRSSQDGKSKAAVLRRFTEAAESFRDAIANGDVTHDGDPQLHRHMINARERENAYGVGIGKSSRHSSAKVDGAVTANIARIARTDYLALPDSRKRKGPTDRRVVVLGGGRTRRTPTARRRRR